MIFIMLLAVGLLLVAVGSSLQINMVNRNSAALKQTVATLEQRVEVMANDTGRHLQDARLERLEQVAATNQFVCPYADMVIEQFEVKINGQLYPAARCVWEAE